MSVLVLSFDLSFDLSSDVVPPSFDCDLSLSSVLDFSFRLSQFSLNTLAAAPPASATVSHAPPVPKAVPTGP